MADSQKEIRELIDRVDALTAKVDQLYDLHMRTRLAITRAESAVAGKGLALSFLYADMALIAPNSISAQAVGSIDTLGRAAEDGCPEGLDPEFYKEAITSILVHARKLAEEESESFSTSHAGDDED